MEQEFSRDQITDEKQLYAGEKKDILNRLQKEILLLQGYFSPLVSNTKVQGLAAIEANFPNAIFPVGAIHEFLCTAPEHAAATGGFLAGLLQTLMQHEGICLWIGVCRTLFPPALKAFGIDPERIIFIDPIYEKEVIWAAEEALKCKNVTAVIAELREINFAQSRRLQLCVEKSRVTGFILRKDPRKISTTACVARWKVSPLASEPEQGMPGVGLPRWTVDLLKVRNGNPGSWQIEWSCGQFNILTTRDQEKSILPPQQQAG